MQESHAVKPVVEPDESRGAIQLRQVGPALLWLEKWEKMSHLPLVANLKFPRSVSQEVSFDPIWDCACDEAADGFRRFLH